MCIDATFADDNFIGWDGVSQAEGGRDVCVEGFQISVIDANNFRTSRQRQFQFRFGMDFDKACESQASRHFGKFTQLCQCQDRDDEQNCVRTCESRLIDMIRVDSKIFPQEGERHRFTDSTQIGELTGEKFSIGQYRNC